MPSKTKHVHKAKWQDDILGISVLMLLYCLQGIPLGLIFGSLPFVMAERLSYTDQATFSLAAYPFSLKLLWSPIVDAVYLPQFGRRKSWIFPLQILMGVTMIFISYHFDDWSGVTGNGVVNIWSLTVWMFLLIFFTATQDIAVDGWALTILSVGNRELQAMCQTIGQTFGYALGFPVFLALNSPEICTKWFGSEKELITPSSFLMLCGTVVLVTNVLVTVFISERAPTRREQADLNHLSIRSTYLDIVRVLQIPNVLKLVLILLTCRLAFTCVDSVTPLKLNEKGFPKETAGLLVFVYVPFELVFPLLIAYLNMHLQWSKMRLWQAGFQLRIVMSFLIVSLVYGFALDETGNVPYSFLLRQILTAVTYSFTSGLMFRECTVFVPFETDSDRGDDSFTSGLMFTSQCGFFAKVADETIGGTYLTLLNTVSNLGGTWPKYFVLRSIDWFTVKHEIECVEQPHDGKPCFEIDKDGYYYVTIALALFGIAWITFVGTTLLRFDDIPKADWTVKRAKRDID
eukprot:CAMPEP_0202728330 /NCGR_PEP_ID=MMETSP1385-20130828/185572_1 /ASSEMBLY_ACC=CAM_ASM_000861 /TAXON_ID=933848 /ORGANISM="Elphidium margaritaceum" /LENGTH=515 /DNA_ID=CAMNT_0049394577 /DNA_START=41 /DNA_END=1589 /DNA_ORIENTATION=-